MGKDLQLVTHALPSGSIDTYLQKVNQFPVLTAEQEYDLATRYHRDGDLHAAQQLVLSHLRYVAKVARGYMGYGLAISDLIQEGTIGLMKAVKRFDPTKGVRLVSFAVHWVKSEIHDYVIRNWKIVKVATTKPQRKLFFNLRSKKKRLGWSTDEEITEIANDLGVSKKDVIEMEKRLNAQDAAFGNISHEEDSFAPEHYLEAAPQDEPLSYIQQRDEQQEETQLVKAITHLDNRSQDILQSRWLAEKKAPLKDLAEKHGVSIERIRQLEKAALMKLRENLEASQS